MPQNVSLIPMDALQDLYQEMIVDHNRHPRNFGRLPEASHVLQGNNPLCGDQLTLYLRIDTEQVQDARFDGEGCAISVASASLMTDAVKGKSIPAAQQLFEQFHQLISGSQAQDSPDLGKLSALAGVRAYPSRVKCATLCWHTLRAALAGEADPVSTE